VNCQKKEFLKNIYIYFQASWNSVFWYRPQQLQSSVPVCLLHWSKERQADKWADIVDKKPGQQAKHLLLESQRIYPQPASHTHMY